LIKPKPEKSTVKSGLIKGICYMNNNKLKNEKPTVYWLTSIWIFRVGVRICPCIL